MSTFLANLQSEADRLRAGRDAVAPLLEVFRKHPKSQWQTMLAELSLALEKEMGAGEAPLPRVTRTAARAANGLSGQRTLMPETMSAASPAVEPDRSERAYEIIRAAGIHGISPGQLGAAIYGADDERGHHKARALVHHLIHKKKRPIDRNAVGRWIVPSVSEKGGAKTGAA